MKKISASILSAIMMLSMIFSSSVFAANDQTQTSAWDSFVGLFTKATTAGTMGVEYAGWVQDVGQTPTDGTYITGPGQLGTPGLSRRLEGFQIKLTGGAIPTGASIKYIVHVQDYGWMGNIDDTTTWKANGTYAGTKDESKRIEDIKIVLVGADGKKLPGYSVSYKGHVENEGDTAWVSDGASFNNTGKSQRLECLEVKITQTKADMTAYNAAVAKAKAVDGELFTTTTYAALTKALADNVVTDTDTQVKVDAATTAITTAFNALVPVSDLDAYNAAVTKANAAVKADYTADSYAALTKALADNVVTGDDTQAKVDAATTAINAAYDKLVLIVKISSVEATGAKILTVTFNQEITDTSKAVFEVKKGSVKVNTSSITWNADATKATIVLSGKLSAGDYTVNVTGLQADTLTGKVTVTNETVNKVTILSETAPILVSPGGSAGTATVGYKVENQYGEDITATTTLTATAGGAVVRTGTASTAVKGVATIPITDTAKEGDTVVLTLINTDTGKSDSKTLKIATKSAVSDIAITALYNKDGKTLTETSDLTKDSFYLLVEAKDQYGQAVKPVNIIGLIGNNTNNTIAQINGNANPTIETITVDGTEVAAVKITNGSTGVLKAGSTSIMLIAPSSGKNASYTVDVAEAQRVDTISFDVPSVVAASETLFIPVQATDKQGNAVTDEKVLKAANRGVTLSGITGATFTTKDGVLGVSIPGSSLASEGYQSLVGVTSTYKTTVANIQVKAKAAPVIVTGLSSTASTTLRTNGSLALTTANIIAEDQYGRVMTAAALNSWLAADTTNNKILVTDTAATIVSLSSPAYISNGNSTVTVTAGTTKGTEKVTLTVANAANPSGLATSAKDVTFQVTDGTEFASYTVDAVGTVYDEKGNNSANTDANAYDKTVKVYGVLSNGGKVLLSNSTDYSVSSTNATLNTDLSDGVIDITSAYTYPTGVTEIKLPITVTINASGEKLSQEITISKVAPDVKTLQIVENGTIANTTLTPVTSINYDATGGAFDFAKLAAAVDVVVTDQYGVKTELTAANTAFPDGTAIVNALTFSKVSGENVFTGNGTGSATVTEMPTDSIFNTVVNSSTISSTPLRVVVTNSYSTAQLAAQAAIDAITAPSSPATANFTLPVTSNSQTVTWSSDNAAIAVSGANATVTRPAYALGDTSVTLSASVTVNGHTATGDYTVVVTKLPSTVTNLALASSHAKVSAVSNTTPLTVTASVGILVSELKVQVVSTDGSTQSYTVTSADGSTTRANNDTVLATDKLVVKAADNTTTATYTVAN